MQPVLQIPRSFRLQSQGGTSFRRVRAQVSALFRADAVFAKPEIYETLEQRGVKFAIRLPAIDSLRRDIEELLTRSVGAA